MNVVIVFNEFDYNVRAHVRAAVRVSTRSVNGSLQTHNTDRHADRNAIRQSVTGVNSTPSVARGCENVTSSTKPEVNNIQRKVT